MRSKRIESVHDSWGSGPLCPTLASTIKDANNLLATNNYDGPPSTLFGSGSADRTEAVNDASILNNYNNGTAC